MKDGKIYLSIDDAVALTLENNLDLDIARYNLNIAQADLLRAKSGGSILGVNTGVVQNTPGGGVGGLGGTVVGAFIMTIIGNLVFVLSLSSFWQPIASGGILLAAVLASALTEKLAKRDLA